MFENGVVGPISHVDRLLSTSEQNVVLRDVVLAHLMQRYENNKVMMQLLPGPEESGEVDQKLKNIVVKIIDDLLISAKQNKPSWAYKQELDLPAMFENIRFYLDKFREDAVDIIKKNKQGFPQTFPPQLHRSPPRGN